MEITTGLAGNRNTPRLEWVFVLSVTSLRTYVKPPILLDQPNSLTHLGVIRGGPRLGDERAAGSSRKCPNIHSRLDGRPQSGPARRPFYHARSIQLRRSLCPCQLCGWVRLNTVSASTVPTLCRAASFTNPAVMRRNTVFPLPGLRLPLVQRDRHDLADERRGPYVLRFGA